MDDLFPFGWFLFIGLSIAGSLYYNHQKKQAKDKAWWQFAQANGLTFVPGEGFRGNSYVTGNYKGYPIILETLDKNEGKSKTPYSCFRLMAKIEPKEDHLLAQFPPGQSLTVGQVGKLLTPVSPIHFSGDLGIQGRGQYWGYEQRGHDTDVTHIQGLFELLIDLSQRYPQGLLLGGDAVKALHELTSSEDALLKPVALQLLRDIAEETTSKLEQDIHNLFCPVCLTGGTAHKIPFPWWQSLTYYGCRNCGQSRQFLKGPLIAILDNRNEAQELVEGHQALRVNWSHRRVLFDFSRVAILQATDEEVERFAVQVGNDTDKYRKPRYAKMSCAISAQCHLSENTLRILERMFGEVTIR